jgi:hypothetical protein
MLTFSLQRHLHRHQPMHAYLRLLALKIRPVDGFANKSEFYSDSCRFESCRVGPPKTAICEIGLQSPSEYPVIIRKEGPELISESMSQNARTRLGCETISHFQCYPYLGDTRAPRTTGPGTEDRQRSGEWGIDMIYVSPIHTTTLASAASVCGNQKVMSIPRYISIAVDSAVRACSRWPVTAYSVPSRKWQ